ncbi:MAG: toll/interleukin-1 receptor domain-containing protein, partial [Gammaproteobacteria bacterium]
MPEFAVSALRYKAYISYSHEDARWAEWLHRALESYRVPRRLVGTASAAGEVPARLAPIFRDRDDLSTSHSLDSDLASALEESEALIVICSLAAAASRWVNEEIRRFKALGRSERVFCMIVDGDPEAAPGQGGAFPPALFEGVAEGGEPLAADARDFADGKRLARQKMVAGLLGVRLDEIRQRDLKRRRRWQLLGGSATAAVLVLAVTAWQSAVAERQEREKAEQMAGFIVALVDDLSGELDLESLSRMSAKALEYWENLDPEKLSPESRIKVGKALRQIGRTTEQQGRYDEALDYLLRSRDLFRGLRRERPDVDEALFELGQAEFWVAYFHYNRGDMRAAEPGLREYDRISRELYRSDPDNERWLLEFSYAVTGILALKILSGEPLGPEVLAEADEALSIAKQALDGDESDTELLSNYSTTVAWASDAHYKACELDKVVELRRERLALTERTLEEDPSDNEAREQLAYAHTGLGRVMLQIGQVRESERHLRQAVRILRDRVAQDPSNQRLWQEMLVR